jgi:hypothetical protein
MSEDQTEDSLPPGIRGSKQDIQELLDLLNAVDPETGKTASELFEEGLRHDDQASEAFWRSLTKEQQLQAFCAVSRRIRKGELELGGSYRYVLYQVFGFGPEAYVPAMYAGYMDIHNAICADELKPAPTMEQRNEQA